MELVWYICACHCGATLFRAKHKRLVAPEHAAGEDGGTDTQQPYVNACNCSICNKNGYLLIYVLRSNMEFIRGWDELRNYRFASKTRDHKFCGECGTSIGIDFLGKHKSGDDIIALNVSAFHFRCSLYNMCRISHSFRLIFSCRRGSFRELILTSSELIAGMEGSTSQSTTKQMLNRIHSDDFSMVDSTSIEQFETISSSLLAYSFSQ